MLFSEANREWPSIPHWAEFLIRLGCDWPRGVAENRRIALVSMPCDSAAAGLVALGAMIRDLSDPHANDVDGHYNRLLQYARQYLESCRDCELTACDPPVKRCGHLKEVTGVVRSPRFPNRPHKVSDKTDVSQRRLAFDYRKGTYWPNPEYLIDWHVDGEPPPQWNTAEGELEAHRYQPFVHSARFHSDNLRKSYSGLCLAGRTGGGNASKEVCASVRFRDGTEEHGLEELLTIHEWSDCNISRVAFFNARTGQFDRNVVAPRLVVADGDTSFLKVAGQTEFHRSDIVGVIHRTVERDRLEALGNKMSDLRQWYVQDEDMLLGLPEVPRGMSISILGRRA